MRDDDAFRLFKAEDVGGAIAVAVLAALVIRDIWFLVMEWLGL